MRSSSFPSSSWVVAAMVLLAALSRLLPHPPNFSPIEAIALFAGTHMSSRLVAAATPLLALLLSDLLMAALLGPLYAGYMGSVSFWCVYGTVALLSVLGWALRSRLSPSSILGYATLSAVIFFLTTNLGAWLGSPFYPATPQGLLMAYLAGLPFFPWTWLGAVLWSAALFGGYHTLSRKWEVLRPEASARG